MRIETFDMERMQSTWENIVDYDMSESGIRPLTLRELTTMGFDLEGFLDEPLGYSQSNGTIELRQRIAALYPGAGIDHVEVTNGTSEANYLIALSQIEPGDVVAMQVPNYMQMWGVARSLGADVRAFSLRPDQAWEPDWQELERAVTRETRLVYLSNPNNPTGSVLSDAAMQRIVDRCEQTGTWLLADEVYLGAEIDGPRTRSFWGMSDRVIVTSGLSKAYGIPGVRIGWIVGPPAGGRPVLESARLHHDRSQQALGSCRPFRGRAREPGTVLREDGRAAPTQPPDRAGLGRVVRRAAHLDGAAGGGHRVDEVLRRHAQPDDCGSNSRRPEHPDRARKPGRRGGAHPGLARGAGSVPEGRSAPDWRRIDGSFRLSVNPAPDPPY